MRHLFCMITTWITNQVTGLDNNCLKLWEVGTWIKTNHHVTIWFGIICACVAILVVMDIIESIASLYRNCKDKHSTTKES